MRKWPCYAILALVLTISTTWATVYEGSCDETRIENCNACQDPSPICSEYGCTSNTIISRDQSKCMRCPDNCDSCVETSAGGATECATCGEGFYVDDDKECGACAIHCEECDKPGKPHYEPDCTKCQEGYFEANEYTCQACGGNCLMCDDSSKCTTCRNSFYLDGGECQPCPGGSDCVDCTTSKSQKCDICSNRKYWNPASSTCSNCLSHCAECSDGDTCEECDDGYFVSQDGSACLSAQNCAEYEDNTGCSSCEAGYRKQTSDDTCYECPTYTTGNCDSCHLENGRGRFFDETRQFCSYCMDNCDSCTDSDTCDEAVDGYIVDTRDSDDATAGVQHSCITCDSIPVVGGDWNSHHDLSTPEGRNRKMDDCRNCGRYVVDDDPTDEVVRCEECPTPIVLDDLSTSEKCEYCKEENTGHYYARGVCAVVDCSREISTISEGECGVCPEKYWDGTVCTDSNCAQAADQITDQAQCQSCSEKYWREPYCRVLARRECDASIGTDHLCSACSAHRWDSTDNMCKGVDCENADEDACQYCVGKWWINGECVDTCDGSVTIDDMLWCHNCPGKLWDASGNGGSGSCDDISTECNDLNTVADADHCYACGMRGVEETSWDGTTCAAYSCDAQALDNEQACRACRRFVKVWNNNQCEAVDCDGPPSTEVPCEACQGHYWDGSCQTVDCSTLDLSTVTSEDMCRACAHERASWDGSTCVQLQSGCETASDYTTLNDCLTCPATYFVAGTCNELDCTTFGSLVPEACSRCPGAAIVDNTCAIVDCSGDLTEEDQCKACSDKFWESGECKDRNNYCNDGIIHDDNRCEQCSVNDEFRLWVPENQPDDPGKCYACPDDCVRCNHEACTQCVTGKTWDGSMCVECTTSINNENMCGGCAGYVWEGGSACNTCPENCLSCTQGATCDICMAGMIWDPSVSACVDCVLDQEEECMTCSIYSGTQAANYLDSEGLCRRCPDGCTACVEQNEECSECASNFYLEATSVAGVTDPVNRCHACTDTLDSSEKCSVCRGDSWYWNSDESSCNECGMGGCLKCDTADVCEQCPSGMWFDQQATSCQACGMNGCESCSSGTVCDRCPTGRWFDDSTPDAPTCRDVVPCSNCRTCSNVGECSECNEGYRSVDGTCVACTDTNCAKCVLDGDQEKCTKCKSSACTDDSGDSTYVQCMETTGPCRGGYCKIDATGYSCLSFDCGTGNYLEVCQKCTAMDCSECDPDDPTVCVTCSEGYRKDSNGDCKSCDEACTTCTTECQCRENQFWDAAADAFQCRDCRSGCKTCNNADACLTCPEGYYQTLDGQNSICKPCSQDIANCVKCLESSGEVQCEKCAGNAYLDGNECKPCSDIDTQCIRCEKDYAGVPVCRECNSKGFYYSKENAECRSCSADFPNCRTCGDKDGNGVISAGECSTCQSGYVRKDDEESCAVCSISDCYECKDPKPQCTECASGFVATETKEQCAHTCYTCLDDGEGNCKEPVKGNSSETITCPGLGQDYACWSIYHKEGEVEKYTRSCSNETCTDEKKKWGCETAQDTKRCRQCCTGDKCNIIEIRTGLGGAERHQVLSRTLICVIAILSILFFH